MREIIELKELKKRIKEGKAAIVIQFPEGYHIYGEPKDLSFGGKRSLRCLMAGAKVLHQHYPISIISKKNGNLKEISLDEL